MSKILRSTNSSTLKSKRKKVVLVCGTRPNVMKIFPLWKEMSNFPDNFQSMIIHTGQHYDDNMFQIFFDNFGLPSPDVRLGVGSGTHAEQTGRIMMKFEKVLLKEKPNLVLVAGDVNSTLACSIAAAKLCIPLAHVEAGLRSFVRTMPEEINRVITDSISDFLFTTCEDANENLKQEGIGKEKIYFVGNTMADTLLEFRTKAKVKAKIKIDKNDYALLTLHRPSNVENGNVFGNILKALQEVSKKIPIVFPAHPRTQKQIEFFGYKKYFSFINLNSSNSLNLRNSMNLLNPLSYLEFLNLMSNAKFVLTDSGGVQEETTILGIPCLTLRENTERPVTVREGTNIVVGIDKGKIISESLKILNDEYKTGTIPKLWDGKAAHRIINILKDKL